MASSTDLRALHAQRLALARTHPVTACEYFLRDEATGKPVQLQPFQIDWHRLLDAHRRVLLHSFTESGKTNALTIGRTIGELAKNTSLRGAIVSNTAHQGQKILGAIARYIEKSTPLRELFPHLQPDTPWHSSAIYLKRSSVSKDPSLQAIGVHGNILGARLDWLVLDDILDHENTRTPEARRDLRAWFDSTLASRLTADARVLVVGSAWHPEDLLHQFAGSSAWHYRRTPVIDANGNSAWPARWPTSRIEQRRAELGTFEFARQMLCLARDEQSARFQKDWLDAAVQRGSDLMPMRVWTKVAGWTTYTGVDLGVSQKPAADLTSFVTIAVGPNGDRRLLSVESGRFTADVILAKIIGHHKRFDCESITVESVAAQAFVVQMVQASSAVPVRGFRTAGGKMSLQYAAEQLAVEFANSKWLIPATSVDGRMHPEVEQLMSEILYYSPITHCGDRVAALLMAVDGAKCGAQRIEWGRLPFLSIR